MIIANRALLALSAATIALGLAASPAAFAQTSQGTMSKDSMKK